MGLRQTLRNVTVMSFCQTLRNETVINNKLMTIRANTKPARDSF